MNNGNDVFIEPLINDNNYLTDETLICYINHMLTSLLNTNIIINIPDSKEPEVIGHKILKN